MNVYIIDDSLLTDCLKLFLVPLEGARPTKKRLCNQGNQSTARVCDLFSRVQDDSLPTTQYRDISTPLTLNALFSRDVDSSAPSLF